MTYGKISKKQQEILDYIKSEILNRGFPPAVREICAAVNLKSTATSAAMPPSREPLRLLTTILIWSAVKW